jgi:hypothetical protein
MTIERGPDDTIVNALSLTARDVANQRVLCPACEAKVFKSWPEGWDAHAEHRCKGLTSSGGEARKAEFKRRFTHLFI